MTSFVTPVGKASFPNLFKPRHNQMSGKDEFSIDILFDKKKTDLSKIKDLLNKVAKDKWGDKMPKFINQPIKDGDGVKPKSGEPYDANYHGHYFITLKNTRQPGVVDAQTQPIINPADIYGGCFVRCSVKAFAYDRSGNKGVSLGLDHVQKVKDGEPFGAARTSAENVFDVIDDDESDNPANYGSANLLG